MKEKKERRMATEKQTCAANVNNGDHVMHVIRRTDRRDQMELIASYLNLDFTVIDGVCPTSPLFFFFFFFFPFFPFLFVSASFISPPFLNDLAFTGQRLTNSP